MKKWPLRIFGFVVIILITLVAFIELNKEKLIRKVVDGINNTLTAELSYQNADVSIFRSFPQLQISLYNIKIHEAEIIEHPLLDLEEFSVDIDLIQVIKNSTPVVLDQIIISNGSLTLIERTDGTNNYSIVNTIEIESEESTPLSLMINSLRLNEVNLIYRDVVNNSQYQLNNVNGQGKVLYQNGAITLSNDLIAKLYTSLSDDPITISSKFAVDVSKDYNLISIPTAQCFFNELALDFNAHIKLSEQDVSYDIEYNAPNSDVRSLLSSIPQIYRRSYETLRADGNFSLSGTIQGTSNDNYPQYDMKLKLENGNVSYPGLPQAIDNIDIDLRATNTDRNTSFTSFIIKSLNLISSSNSISGKSIITNNKNSYSSDIDLTAILDLTKLKDVFPLEPDEELNGKLDGRLKLLSDYNETRQEVVISDGGFIADIIVQNLKYQTKSQKISVSKVKVKNDDNTLIYEVSDLNYPGITGLNMDGTIEEIVSVYKNSKGLNGQSTITIDQINFEAMTLEDDTSSITSLYDIPVLDITTKLNINKINYPPYEIINTAVNGNLSNNKSDIEFSIAEFDGNSLSGRGSLTNLLQYGINNDTIRGGVQVESDYMNLDKYFVDSSVETPSSPTSIPGNIDIDLDYNIDKVSLLGMDLSKALGDLSIKDQIVELKNVANVFGGKITTTGSFNTKNPEVPNINFNISINDISFKETAKQLTIFNKILPIASFFEGEYSGTLNWNSDLDNEYMPLLNTLSSYGEIETKNGAISSFVPVDTILKFFGKSKEISKEWSFDNTKKYFLIEDGKVIVKEINLQKEDINVSYYGSHSFEQDIDYDMTVSIPKDKLNIDKIYDIVADKLGIEQKLASIPGDVRIELMLKLGGKLNKPSFKLKDIAIRRGQLVESIKQSAINTAKEKKEVIVNTVSDTLETIKNEITDSINNIKTEVLNTKDSISDLLTSQIDSSRKEIEDQGATIIDSLKAGNIDSLSKNIEDIFKGQKTKIDLIKDQIKINPFKKKDGN